MAGFIIRLLLYIIPMMFAISVVTFIIIQSPGGNWMM
ncbi:ABC transporter permease, partial [Rhizobium ruizarguesonis]